MIDLSYREGSSILHRMDPSGKFAGLILCSLLILLTSGLTGLAVSVLVLTVLVAISGISAKDILHPLKKLIWFLIMIFLMNVLFFETDNCLFRLWILCVSEDGLIKGFNILQHTTAVTILSTLFIRTTTSVGIMKGIDKLLHPLRWIGVPTRDIALIMSIALQFIPVFFNDLERIRKAQIARGADFTGGSLKDKAKAVFPLVIPAFVSAFRRADELSDAIEARGYQSDR